MTRVNWKRDNASKNWKWISKVSFWLRKPKNGPVKARDGPPRMEKTWKNGIIHQNIEFKSWKRREY